MSFGRESDPVLAAEAMPFALKTMDMLAIQQPNQPDVQLAAGRAYIQYSNAFLDWEARKQEFDDVMLAKELRTRAARLYLRGRDYAAASLGISDKNPISKLKENPDVWLKKLNVHDVPALYWMAAGWAAAVASDPSNMDEVANMPLIEKMMLRARELNPDAEQGAIHEFFIVYDGSRSPAMGGDPARAEESFHRALVACDGKLASPYVSLATSVMIQKQDAKRFRELLSQALAIDINILPDSRLANVIAQDKARWYLDHIGDFILSETTESP